MEVSGSERMFKDNTKLLTSTLLRLVKLVQLKALFKQYKEEMPSLVKKAAYYDL